MGEHDTAITAYQYEDIKCAFRYAFQAVRDAINVCIPCIVVSYDRKRRVATVQEAVKKPLPKEGEVVYEQGLRMSVRVLTPTVGGFSIDIPIQAGDKGWLMVSDVDTSILWKNGAPARDVVTEPASESEISEGMLSTVSSTLTHLPACGVFIPDGWGDFDATNVRNLEGQVSEGDMYIGEAVKDTCAPLNEDWEPQSDPPPPVDGLPSITISRGEGNRGVLISVGSMAGISVRGSQIKLLLQPGGEEGGEPFASVTLDAESKEVRIHATNVQVDAESCSLPENTTVGGKRFTSIALQ